MIGWQRKANDWTKGSQERVRDLLMTVLTIMLAVLLFVVAPLQAAGMLAAHHFGIAFAVALTIAVFLLSRSPFAVVALLIAIALVVAATILRMYRPSATDVGLDASAWLIASIVLGIFVGRAVLAPGPVTYHRIIGAILLYLNIGLLFVALFCFVELALPHALRGILPLRDNFEVASDLTYFSFVNLTSVGYGDIVPLHPYARSLANIEAIIGQLYPATLLARIVSLQLAGNTSDK